MSWTAGWANLLGQVAGVASGGYSGAQIIANMVYVNNNYSMNAGEVLALYFIVLVLAGIVNTFAETLLTSLCYISVAWHIIGTTIIVVWMLSTTPTIQDSSFVASHYNNDTGFSSVSYVAFAGVLAAASTFTGYDTAAHVAEETTNSHNSTPIAMLGSVLNCLFLGLFLIIGMNYCIQDISKLTTGLSGNQQAYTVLWQETVGNRATIFFLAIVFVGIECSNCANLTSASRMVYSFARDGAVPFSSYFYSMDKYLCCPLRSIWFCVLFAFILGVPGLGDSAVLGALFSMTATGLYTSYMIPIFLRVTIGKELFQPAEFNLGKYSIPIHWFSGCWCIVMVICLCLPEVSPLSVSTLNYSPVVLALVVGFAWIWWFASARYW
jgi:amino acid transporter